MANVLDRDYGSLTGEVVLFTDRRTILKVVAAIRPEATLNDVVRVCRRAIAEDTFVPITGEYAFTKLITTEKFRFHAFILTRMEQDVNCFVR